MSTQHQSKLLSTFGIVPAARQQSRLPIASFGMARIGATLGPSVRYRNQRALETGVEGADDARR